MPSETRAHPRKCPVCGAPRADSFRPFCSRGCRDRDLLGWFGETYRVPAAEAPDGGMGDGPSGEE